MVSSHRTLTSEYLDRPIDAACKRKEFVLQMAKSNTTRTESLNYGPDKGGAILAAWRGLYWLFGARVDAFHVTPEGILVEGLTMAGDYNPSTIVEDISKKNRRLELVPTYFYVNGTPPEPFDISQEITQFMVQFFRGSVEENSSRAPQYLRKAAAEFKTSVGLKSKRGPKRKVIRVDQLENVDMEVLKQVPLDELEKFMETLRNTIDEKHTASVATA